MVVIAVILAAVTFVYGFISVTRSVTGDKIKLSIVQGNIEQSKKWDPRHAAFIMGTYSKLTMTASEARPELIIWPEAATPRAINQDLQLYSQVRDLAENAGTYLLLGSSSYQKFKRKGPQKLKYTNSAFLIDPYDSSKVQRYDKNRLVPFGEYLPYKEMVPWSYIHIPDPGAYIAGSECTLFNLPNSRFAVNICWEITFPDLIRGFVKRGAQFIINITNEAWFGKNRSSLPDAFDERFQGSRESGIRGALR
ncbi:Apolipoprotein N-acyltransferase [subsurface metagenome]